MNKPLVSFFLSTYNRREEVLNTLGKLYEQTYRPMEIVVADNCSIDGTFEIIKEKFPEVNCFRLQKNIGGIAARNLACQKTTGRYLVSLDDDSFPGKHCIDRMVERFEKEPDLGLICFNVYNQRAFIDCYDDEKHLSDNVTAIESYQWSGCGGGYRKEIVDCYGYWEEWGHTSPYELSLTAKVMKMGMTAKNFNYIYVFHSFASYVGDGENKNKWAYPVDKKGGYRTNQIGNYTSARNTLLFVLKFYPMNLKTLAWLTKYVWCVAVDLVERKRFLLVGAFLKGIFLAPRFYHERLILTQSQADKVPASFNFKGK